MAGCVRRKGGLQPTCRSFCRERFFDVVLCGMYSLGYRGAANLVARFQITHTNCLASLSVLEPGQSSNRL